MIAYQTKEKLFLFNSLSRQKTGIRESDPPAGLILLKNLLFPDFDNLDYAVVTLDYLLFSALIQVIVRIQLVG